ncbi:MAG: hypothetical protein ACRC0X_02115 [Brevinema sp.]
MSFSDSIVTAALGTGLSLASVGFYYGASVKEVDFNHKFFAYHNQKAKEVDLVDENNNVEIGYGSANLFTVPKARLKILIQGQIKKISFTVGGFVVIEESPMIGKSYIITKVFDLLHSYKLVLKEQGIVNIKGEISGF